MSHDECTTADLSLYLTDKADKEILAKILNGAKAEVSMSFKHEQQKSAELERWNDEVLTLDEMAAKVPMNPCRKIIMKTRNLGKTHSVDALRYNFGLPALDPIKFRQEYEAELMNNNKTPHTSQVDETAGRTADIRVNGSGLTGQYKVTDETATLRVEMPGVAPERVEIKRIDNLLRIRVQEPDEGEINIINCIPKPPRQLYLVLADEETVEETEFEFGVLTVVVERNRHVEEYSV